MDCLIISYSEPSRNRERIQFYTEDTKSGDGWGRFLHMNYVGYENDILLPNHLASIAKLTRDGKPIQKTKKGHFLESDIMTYSAWKIPMLGGLYLYQYLKSLNHDVRNIQHVQLEQQLLDVYLKESPKVIAISTTLILNPMDTMELVEYCRSKSPESFIVVGGMGVWNNYLTNKENPNMFKIYAADAVVLDPKGAKTLGVLVDRVKNVQSLDDVPNLVIYDKRSTVVTPKQPESFDFQKDAMRWDLIDDHLLGNITLMRTQISCPFTCSFCSYPVNQGAVQKTEMETFEAELKMLQKRGIRYLLFVDDTFNVPKARFRQLMTILKKYDFQWYAFIRCQYLDPQLVIDMKESGCGGAFLGIESANNDILKAMNKRATDQDYRKGVELMASQGITTFASFIIGFPGETEATVRDTQNFIETSGIDFYNVKLFYYEHSTPISQQTAEYSLTGRGMNWKHNTMNSTEAFTHAEEVIKQVKHTPYIPQLSGEIWEIAHFHEQGFSNQKLHSLYGNFTQMLQDELSEFPQKSVRQRELFANL